MQKDEMLKSCPFCGSTAEILKNKDGLFAVACTSGINTECFLYSGHDERIDHNANWDDVMTWYAKKTEAIKAWNRRTK